MSHTERGLKEQLRALVAEIAEKDEIPDGASFKDLGHRLDDGRRDRRGRSSASTRSRSHDDELAGFKDLAGAYALVVKKLEEKSAIAAARSERDTSSVRARLRC